MIAAILLALAGQAAMTPAERESVRRDLKEVIAKMGQSVERQSDAIGARLAAHRVYEECVRQKVRKLVSSPEHADILADSAMFFCQVEEDNLRSRAFDQSTERDFAKQHEQVDAWMKEWNRQIRIEATSIVLSLRVGIPMPTRSDVD
jgi:hypothetical protein